MAINIEDMEVNLTWLRDNCRCENCFDWYVHQRKLNNIEINKLEIISFKQEGNEITIIWNDSHVSKYDINWIRNQQRPEIRPENKLWIGHEKEHEIPIVSNNETENHMVKTLTLSILQYGIGIVKDVPQTKEDTEKTINKLGPVMHTIYGGMWEVTSLGFKTYKDTAYTNQELSAHTDNTYFIEPAGLQIFHCLKQANQGGETVLIDGFKAAQILKQENKRYYECLKSTPVEWQYISNKHRYTCMKPVINTFPKSENLEQIRFNIYDRSPRICSSPEYDQNTIYSSLKHFRDIVHDEKMKLKLLLAPGMLIFINNWRVLHGRTRFSGERILVGSYMGMNALLSKARFLNLIR